MVSREMGACFGFLVPISRSVRPPSAAANQKDVGDYPGSIDQENTCLSVLGIVEC